MKSGTPTARIESMEERFYPQHIVEDLLDDTRYVWQSDWNYVKLDPAERVAHIFVVRA